MQKKIENINKVKIVNLINMKKNRIKPNLIFYVRAKNFDKFAHIFYVK